MTSPASTYLAGVAAGVLRYQTCAACSRSVFYPRVLCPHCGSTALHWRDSEGRGAVYAHTWVHERTGGYSVALIDLDEGFRMMSTVIAAAPEDIAPGLRVRVGFDETDGEPRVVFTLDGESKP